MDLKMIEGALFRLYENQDSLLLDNNEDFVDFHLAIAKATHNFVFVNIMEWHMHLFYKTRTITSYISERNQEKFKEHEAIFEAIKEHNSKKAAKLTLKHIEKVKNAIIRVTNNLR